MTTITLKDKVLDLAVTRYAASGRPLPLFTFTHNLNTYTAQGIKGALTRLAKDDLIQITEDYTGPLYAPTPSAPLTQYYAPDAVMALGLIPNPYSVPMPGFLCRTCGSLVVDRPLHTNYHASQDSR
jgi:hypothetical protein